MPAGRRVLACFLVALAFSGACQRAARPSVHLTLWAHSGQPGERSALTHAVAAFERDHPGTTVSVRVIPEGDYGDVVQTAIVGRALPDVLDLDGPRTASYASQGALRPLDGLIPGSLLSGLLPSIRTQGTWQGRFWALGTFDSGLVLYADRRALRAAGLTWPPSVGRAWTGAQLTDVLRRLAARDPDHRVLDLKLLYGTGEWLTYGFAPLLYSAGGALLDPHSGRAHGAMDSAASVHAFTLLQSWARYVDADPQETAFVQRRVALSWSGHWSYPDYRRALGDDLLLLPLPDLGNGSKSGQGSWAWAVSAASKHPHQAADLLAWFASDENVAAWTAGNGAIPGTRSALARATQFQPGGPLALFADQLELTCGSGPVTRACVTVPRPVTPDYPLVTTAFAQAVHEVLLGRDPAAALRAAATTVDGATAG